MIEALHITVKGIVQGVGFRPFVYRIARKNLVNGWVLNNVEGVHIHAEAETELLDAFVEALSNEAPAASKVEEILLDEVPLEHFNTFEIRMSEDKDVAQATLVSPDLATCAECVAELKDPRDRRYHYPFINCTNCGPRYTIMQGLPYDRPLTSMGKFPMCPDCADEYKNPENRRFHAQPDACGVCGPHVTLYTFAEGETQTRVPHAADCTCGACVTDMDLIDAVVDVLADGGVVAIKGLGGFHLACNAADTRAIARLRAGKKRSNKALAVMAADVPSIGQAARVSEEEAKILSSTAAPIVLLRKKPGVQYAQGLADGLSEIGIMPAYTPVQHLLFESAKREGVREKFAVPGVNGGVPLLVMTSANMHDEPIVISDERACELFGPWVDAVLGNNRDICNRFDDSVVRVLNFVYRNETAVQSIRRARGYAPRPLSLPDYAQIDDVALACGPEQKNTFTFTQGKNAFMSQHIGDMENAETNDAWLEAHEHMAHLFRLKETMLVADCHPEYLSTKWAREQERTQGLPLVEVQHHHAHIASVIGECALPADKAVCGIAFDGTGFGSDGHIWGGEVLLANASDFERFANFVYVPMPGGAAAVKNPLRMAYGVLWAYDLLGHPAAALALEPLGQAADVCAQMIDKGINCPLTSSVGRLFDAASALLGICTQPTYEGEGAVLLEATMENGGFDEGSISDEDAGRYAVFITKNAATEGSTAHDTSVVLLDAASTFQALLDDLEAGVAVGRIARCFHEAILGALCDAALLVRELYGIDTVALSGGVFCNRFLAEQAVIRLSSYGLNVAMNQELPPNDGCISYGQAVVALSQTKNRKATE